MQSHMTENLGDSLSELPVHQRAPTQEEVQIINTLFKQEKNTIIVLLREFKDSIMVGVLFGIFSSEQVDKLLRKVSPRLDNSPILLLLSKCLLIGIVFWLLKHYMLAKVKN